MQKLEDEVERSSFQFEVALGQCAVDRDHWHSGCANHDFTINPHTPTLCSCIFFAQQGSAQASRAGGDHLDVFTGDEMTSASCLIRFKPPP